MIKGRERRRERGGGGSGKEGICEDSHVVHYIAAFLFLICI